MIMDPTDIAQQEFDDSNNNNEGAWLKLFSDDVKVTHPGGVVFQGWEGLRKGWDIWQHAFPGNHSTINNIFGTDDQACVEATFEGTQNGMLALPGRQIPPTGRDVSLSFVNIYTISDDKIATLHTYFDQLDLLAQLGVEPSTASSNTATP